MTGRIVGGSNSPATPYYAHIEYKNAEQQGFFGGGSLISQTHVLTAAHIIYEMATWTVSLGATSKAALVDHPVQTALHHENYNFETRENDIGYIILETPVELTLSIAVIALPRITDFIPHENEQGTLVGFGWINPARELPTILQRSFQRVINDTECAKSFIVTEGLHFCARDEENSNVCYGDLGSGLVIEHRGVRTLVGIASITMVSCDATHPTAYTRVLSYRPWIDNILQD